MIVATAASTCGSCADSNASSSASRASKSGCAVSRRRIAIIGRRAAKASSSGWISARFTFSAAWFTIRRALIGAISSTRLQIVGAQRVAAAHQVDDRIGEPGERRELHRAVELDEIDVHALRGEMLARRLHVLGRDLQPRALLHRAPVVEPRAHGDHHAAARDARDRAAGRGPARRARRSTSLPATPRSAAPYCT